MFNELETLYTYTREQALEDGFLIDVTKTAKEAGLRYPVAVTSAVWEKYIAWEDEDTQRQTHQDSEGRLWDVLFMLKNAINRLVGATTEIHYELYVVPRDGKARKPKKTALKSLCHPGDSGEPVITIMEPDED